MNYTLENYRVLYERAYQDATRALDAKNTALACTRFYEAAQCSRKLAEIDAAGRDNYLVREKKLLRIAKALEDSLKSARSTTTSTQGTGQLSTHPSSETDNDSPMEDMSSFYTFYHADDISSGFDKVIGLDEAKDAVTEYVINPIKYPDAYNYDFMDNKCILLEGPPGTGKTTFAKAVAKEINQPFALVNVASLVNCYVGETAKTIDKVFASLRSYAERNKCGITVFFDEFDEIAKRRDGDDKASQTAVPALLRNLDGVQRNKNFLIIANTNCQDMLDAGIKDRFRRKIHIPLPDLAMRERFFKDKLHQLEGEYFSQLDLPMLAAESEGLSGRSISQICDDFLYFVAAVKAGLTSCDSYNDVLINMIHNA